MDARRSIHRAPQRIRNSKIFMNPVLTYNPAQADRSVASFFESQVALSPHALALQDAGESLSYDALNRRANQLAYSIIAERGSASSEPIAILMEQNSATVVAILAILKASKFYVPLDLSLPDARLISILQDSGAELIITNPANLERARTIVPNGGQVLDIENLSTAASDNNLGLDIPPDALLNLMYTSGTTGEPKGVMQTQRNVLHAVVSTDYPAHQPTERVAQLTAFSFGGSAAMIFRTLLHGAALLPFDLKKAGLPQLTRFLVDNQITRFHTVPSVMRNWLELIPPDQVFSSLRVVEIGGEPLFKRDLVRLLQHLPEGCWVRNALGSTETYVGTWNYVNAKTDLQEGVVPIGWAPPGMQALILDENMQPLGVGETGEIYIKSRYISPGYWHKPEITRATFIPDPNQPGLYAYKTGDLGILRADGALEHLGRKDGMVKIRGHQVVLTFIEGAMRALENLKDVAVIAEPSESGDHRLIAYLVSKTQPAPSSSTLRNSLALNLPDYMIPSLFVTLAALPRFSNGKLDRRSLPALDNARPLLETAFVAPQTPLELTLAQIWSQVLGISQIGIHDAFVELGGNSLQAAQVVSRTSTATGVDIPLSAVFDVPTIQGLAQLVTQRLAERTPDDALEQMLREAEELRDPSFRAASEAAAPTMP